VILKTILLGLGGFIFLFAFWKRLKEDYFENQIFSAGFSVLVFVLLANILSFYLAQQYWFWFSLFGMLIGIGFGSWRLGLRFFEVVEATVIASFAPIIGILVYDGISQKHASSFFAISVIALFIGLYYILNTRYKTFSWYKSGRVGFSGLAVLGVFFLTRALVAYRFSDVLSFSQQDWLISSVTAFATFLTLANLTLKKS
jgi:hypothetical protein